jgi:pantothenate kinase
LPEQDTPKKPLYWKRLSTANGGFGMVNRITLDNTIERLHTLNQICTLNQINKPLKSLAILISYLQDKQLRIIHHAKQHRLGWPMSNSHAESAVIADRMRWRMRWSRKAPKRFYKSAAPF